MNTGKSVFPYHHLYLLLSAFLLFACPVVSRCQSLIFCEKVDSSGTPVRPSHIFNISSKGGFMDFLIVLPEGVNSTEIKYDIYSVDNNGKESFDATVSQPVQKEWVWFSKEVTFYKGGDYTVYVYTAEDRLLCTGMVKVVMQ